MIMNDSFKVLRPWVRIYTDMYYINLLFTHAQPQVGKGFFLLLLDVFVITNSSPDCGNAEIPFNWSYSVLKIIVCVIIFILSSILRSGLVIRWNVLGSMWFILLTCDRILIMCGRSLQKSVRVSAIAISNKRIN